MSEYWFRKMTEYDLEFFLEIRNECSEMLHDNSKYTLEQAKEWFNKKNPDFYIINYDNNDIGYFRTSNRTEKTIYIGCDLHKDWRGKGLATMAYKIFMLSLFTDEKIEKIYLEVLNINEVAYNLYLKLGFEVEDFQFQQIERDNKLIDSILMSIKKDHFLQKINFMSE